jgi:hypothetical protein
MIFYLFFSLLKRKENIAMSNITELYKYQPPYTSQKLCAAATAHYEKLYRDIQNLVYYSKASINYLTIARMTEDALELKRMTCANSEYEYRNFTKPSFDTLPKRSTDN